MCILHHSHEKPTDLPEHGKTRGLLHATEPRVKIGGGGGI